MDCASEESEIRRAVEGVPGVLGLRFQLGERSLRIAGGFATLRYIGSQNEDDLGLLRLDDALTLDAGLSWRVTDAVSIEARGENLTDELVPAAISSAGIVERATPRTMWIGGRVTF